MADIFDKIVGGINKGVATIGVGSNAMVEKAKIKTILSNLENERKQLAELLGMKTYEKFAESNETPADSDMLTLLLELEQGWRKLLDWEQSFSALRQKRPKYRGRIPDFRQAIAAVKEKPALVVI